MNDEERRLQHRDYMRRRRAAQPVHWRRADPPATVTTLRTYCGVLWSGDVLSVVVFEKVTCRNCLARHYRTTAAYRLARAMRRLSAAMVRATTAQEELNRAREALLREEERWSRLSTA